MEFVYTLLGFIGVIVSIIIVFGVISWLLVKVYTFLSEQL